MASKLVIPHFPSEDEEAEWLWKHRRELEGEMLRRMKEGTTYRLSRSNADLQPLIIHISRDDLESARQQAARKGVAYQTYIRMILHRALGKQAREKR